MLPRHFRSSLKQRRLLRRSFLWTSKSYLYSNGWLILKFDISCDCSEAFLFSYTFKSCSVKQSWVQSSIQKRDPNEFFSLLSDGCEGSKSPGKAQAARSLHRGKPHRQHLQNRLSLSLYLLQYHLLVRVSLLDPWWNKRASSHFFVYFLSMNNAFLFGTSFPLLRGFPSHRPFSKKDPSPLHQPLVEASFPSHLSPF